MEDDSHVSLARNSSSVSQVPQLFNYLAGNHQGFVEGSKSNANFATENRTVQGQGNTADKPEGSGRPVVMVKSAPCFGMVRIRYLRESRLLTLRQCVLQWSTELL